MAKRNQLTFLHFKQLSSCSTHYTLF